MPQERGPRRVHGVSRGELLHGLSPGGQGRTVRTSQKLAAAAEEKKPIPWVRVYQLPPYVYFSHRVHTAAGTTCETCHGPVAERDRISKEVAHNMRSCMACHAATKARNDCATCHEERH
jgi:c(7)-type cytochrome triheme protein